MLVNLISQTLTPGDTVESGYFSVPDGYIHHSMFTTITGSNSMITAVLKTSATSTSTCDPDDEEILSNVGPGEYRNIVDMDPCEYGNVRFVNNGSSNAYIRAWFCMKRG